MSQMPWYALHLQRFEETLPEDKHIPRSNSGHCSLGRLFISVSIRFATSNLPFCLVLVGLDYEHRTVLYQDLKSCAASLGNIACKVVIDCPKMNMSSEIYSLILRGKETRNYLSDWSYLYWGQGAHYGGMLPYLGVSREQDIKREDVFLYFKYTLRFG